MSNPEELRVLMACGQEQLTKAIGGLVQAQYELEQAQAIMSAVIQEAQSLDLPTTSGTFMEVTREISALQERTAHIPEYTDQFLFRLGVAALGTLAIDTSYPEVAIPELSVIVQKARQAKSEAPVILSGSQDAPPAQAPTLPFAVLDDDRTNPVKKLATYNNTTTEITEQEASRELDAFLKSYIEKGHNEESVKEAESIRNTLNFIGKKELETACKAIAKDWDTYLAEDPERQILVVQGYTPDARMKSGDVIVSMVMNNLPESSQYQVATNVELVEASSDKMRAVIVDDWSLSGRQMSVAAKRFGHAYPDSPYVQNLELNLVIATQNTINNGFVPLANTEDDMDVDYTFAQPIPVKACYTALPRQHDDPDQQAPTEAHITGTHSHADFGFATSIEHMFDDLSSDNAPLPPLPALAE